MAKYKIVKELPEKIGSKDFVIYAPDFTPEIEKVQDRRITARDGRFLCTPNYLRKAINLIGLKYGNENFNYMTVCKVSQYDGVPYVDAKDLNDNVIIPMFLKDYPMIFDDYMAQKLKACPKDAATVYYVGDNEFAEKAFKAHGIEKAATSKKKQSK